MRVSKNKVLPLGSAVHTSGGGLRTASSIVIRLSRPAHSRPAHSRAGSSPVRTEYGVLEWTSSTADSFARSSLRFIESIESIVD